MTTTTMSASRCTQQYSYINRDTTAEQYCIVVVYIEHSNFTCAFAFARSRRDRKQKLSIES